MLTTPKHTPPLGLFHNLGDQLDQKHPLNLLVNIISWSVFEDALKKHYREKIARPAKPIRLMVSLLILKYIRNISDENLVEQWSENIYFQYFSGEQNSHIGAGCVRQKTG